MLPAGALGSRFQAPVLKCVEECGKELRGGHRNAIPGAKVLPISFRLLRCRGQLARLPGKHTEQDVGSSQKSHGAPDLCKFLMKGIHPLFNWKGRGKVPPPGQGTSYLSSHGLIPPLPSDPQAGPIQLLGPSTMLSSGNTLFYISSLGNGLQSHLLLTRHQNAKGGFQPMAISSSNGGHPHHLTEAPTPQV